MNRPDRSTASTSALSPSDDLPKFARPPVEEVAISVQFNELTEFKPLHFGLFYERIRERYPKTEHHPPLSSIVELFGSQRTQGGGASLSLKSDFPTGRYWYLSEDQHRLIQLQPDRFILNWRKLDTDVDYPSYNSLREVFQQELETFLNFAGNNSLGDFEPTQCEVTYVNHLPEGLGWERRADLPNIIAPWSGTTNEPFLPELEDARLSWHYRFEENASPVGRLHVHLTSAIRKKDQSPVFVLQMVGRGAPAQNSVQGVLSMTDKAHVWIVRGFTSITTGKMHALWERQQ